MTGAREMRLWGCNDRRGNHFQSISEAVALCKPASNRSHGAPLVSGGETTGCLSKAHQLDTWPCCSPCSQLINPLAMEALAATQSA